jgi:hypothetical protein
MKGHRDSADNDMRAFGRPPVVQMEHLETDALRNVFFTGEPGISGKEF